MFTRGAPLEGDYFSVFSTSLNVDKVNFQVDCDEFYNQVTNMKTNYITLGKEIEEYEKKIELIEKDIEILSESGKLLHTEETKMKMIKVCEDFKELHKLPEIKQKLESLYHERKRIIWSVSQLTLIDDSIAVSCPVCFEGSVSMFNINCGHTLCDKCAFKIFTKCPICRGPVEYRNLIFSF